MGSTNKTSEEGGGRGEICGSDNVLMADLRALQTVHCSPSMGNNCLIFLFRHIGSNHWPASPPFLVQSEDQAYKIRKVNILKRAMLSRLSSYLGPNLLPSPQLTSLLSLSESRRQQNSVNLFQNYTILFTYSMYCIVIVQKPISPDLDKLYTMLFHSNTFNKYF